MPAYQNQAPFAPSLLVEFRKRITEEILGEINEMIIEAGTEKGEPKDPGDGNSGGGGSENDDTGDTEPNEKRNEGTLIIDATCAP